MRSLSHLGRDGKLLMVDVSSKAMTHRVAKAAARIKFPSTEAYNAVRKNSGVELKFQSENELFSSSKIAGIMAAKNTSQLIPLCHTLMIESVDVCIAWNDEENSIDVEGCVKSNGKTGVEMESLVAVSIASLNLYDMCKAVTKEIRIENVHLVSKAGGKSDK